MATNSIGILIPAAVANSITGINDATTSDVPLQGVVQGDILTAVAAGLFTTTADLAAYSQDRINGIMNMLNGLGYEVSYSGHTLTINWD